MSGKKLKAYMAYKWSDPEEGAALVFAHTAKEAKGLAFRTIWWLADEEWIHLNIKWIKKEPHIFALADQEALKNNEPHVIESPPCCISCSLWGYEVYDDGICEGCGEDAGDELTEVMNLYFNRVPR